MRVFLKTVLVALAISLPSFAAEEPDYPWWKWERPSTTEWVMHFTSEVPLFIDCFQTFDLKKHIYYPGSETWREANPIIGPHPTDLTVIAYIAGVSILHTGLWYALPAPYRQLTDVAMFTVEWAQIYHNASFGMRITLPF